MMICFFYSSAGLFNKYICKVNLLNTKEECFVVYGNNLKSLTQGKITDPIVIGDLLFVTIGSEITAYQLPP